MSLTNDLERRYAERPGWSARLRVWWRALCRRVRGAPSANDLRRAIEGQVAAGEVDRLVRLYACGAVSYEKARAKAGDWAVKRERFKVVSGRRGE